MRRTVLLFALHDGFYPRASLQSLLTFMRGFARRGSGGKAPIVSDHQIIEEGDQEAAIGAFLLAHDGHAQEVEVQRGAWSIYCRCTRCSEIRTYEVDNEAREQVLGLPPRPEVEAEHTPSMLT